jgi:hypothetical protein
MDYHVVGELDPTRLPLAVPVQTTYNGQSSENWTRPKFVCLCGSTRFWREFQRQGLRLTMEGVIVLTIGAASGTDDEHFGNLPAAEYDRIKSGLDQLHLCKIAAADEVMILNVGGYIGQSTRKELDYARSLGKPVVFLEPEGEHTLQEAGP